MVFFHSFERPLILSRKLHPYFDDDPPPRRGHRESWQQSPICGPLILYGRHLSSLPVAKLELPTGCSFFSSSRPVHVFWLSRVTPGSVEDEWMAPIIIAGVILLNDFSRLEGDGCWTPPSFLFDLRKKSIFPLYSESTLFWLT